MASHTAFADNTDDQIKALKDQIDALGEKVRILERQHELDAEMNTTKTKKTPKVMTI